MFSDSGLQVPNRALLERVRTQQRAMLRWLRLLGIAVAVLVIATGIRTHPYPSLQGRGLVVALALVAFGVAIVALMVHRPAGGSVGTAVVLATFALLVLSSATLFALQPNNLGLLGLFVAVMAAALRLPGRAGAEVFILALISVGAAEAASVRPSILFAANGALGVVAFYVVGVLGSRLREGQEQAERLLIELQESQQAQAQAAALAERTRLAREMHDVLAHSLSGLAIQLEGARVLISQRGADRDVANAVDQAHRLARSGLEEARRAIGMLRDEALPGPERLAGLAHDLERDAGIPCKVEVSGGERELDAETRLTLYRVAQEALTNVRKHSSADRVLVQLAYAPTATSLIVEDFGSSGPPHPCENGSGYGLTGMRERAELIGGTLLAAPTESGFRVELRVPA